MGLVTGVLRGRPAPNCASDATPLRSEPTIVERADFKPGHAQLDPNDDEALDIPAFLRRDR